ncbi:MAG TPA: hypothetical protein VF759_07165 [Allosphingosinicella sp.]
MRPLFSSRLLVPVLVLVVLLTATNIVILLNRPIPHQPPPWPFAAAAIARVAGLFLATVAVLRLMTGSSRPAWRPDGAFWLYAATLLLFMAASVAVEVAAGSGRGPAAAVVRGVLVTVGTAPLAAWFTAIAVERPLAWRPWPWFRDFGRWLPQLIFWGLLLATPLNILHALLGDWLVDGAGRWFWPVALVDGPLSAAGALIGFALAAEAYRRVAQH